MKQTEMSLTQQYISTTKRMVMAHIAQHHSTSKQTEERILAMLALWNEVEQTQLAYLLDLTEEMLEANIKSLEKAGYISCTGPEPVRIRLTSAGSEKAGETKHKGDEDVFSCLSQEEQEVLQGFLERIEASLPEEDVEGFSFSSRGMGHSHGPYGRMRRHTIGGMHGIGPFMARFDAHFGGGRKPDGPRQ